MGSILAGLVKFWKIFGVAPFCLFFICWFLFVPSRDVVRRARSSNIFVGILQVKQAAAPPTPWLLGPSVLW
jgi:hypothetical protein